MRPSFRSKVSFLSIALLFAVTACKVGPDYERPQQKLPEKWSNFLEKQESGDHTVEWWSHFQDPILTQLIESVIDQNLDLKSAEAVILQNQALLAESAANILPRFSLSASVSENQSSKNYYQVSHHRRYRFYSDSVGAAWEVDLFGKLQRAKEAAFSNLNVEVENCYGIFLSLVSNVAQTYIRLRGAQQQLMVVTELCEKYKAIYNLQISLQKAGITSQIDVENAKSAWDSYESMKYPLDATIKNYMHALSLLTSQEPQALYALLAPVQPIPVIKTEIFAGLPSHLLERRPDIRKAEMALVSATAQIGIARGGLFPSFNLTGQIGYIALRASKIASPTSVDYSIGPSLTWNIFDFGRVKAQIANSEAFRDQARLGYFQTILTALSEVESALVTYVSESKRLENLTDAKRAQNRLADLTRNRYHVGLEPFIASLQADIAALNQSLDAIDSQATVGLDVVTLYKALGGGWESYAEKKVKNLNVS
jgi:NodT family efflux transporter outer membrane factor (OMF) lipoprotein